MSDDLVKRLREHICLKGGSVMKQRIDTKSQELYRRADALERAGMKDEAKAMRQAASDQWDTENELSINEFLKRWDTEQ